MTNLSSAGVAYQLVEDDPLVNTTQCNLDATLMQQLGANSIRVYHVDASQDHTGCMNAFATAGIYLWVDLDSFHTYIREVRGRLQDLYKNAVIDIWAGRWSFLDCKQVSILSSCHGQLSKV